MGEWQKEFVSKLVAMGISHEKAMDIMGLACELRETSYQDGFKSGYNNGYGEGFKANHNKRNSDLWPI